MKDDGLTFVTNEFAEVLWQTVELSSREMPEVVNGIARDLCFAAARNAKNARVSAIKKWDPNPPDWKRAKEGQRRYKNRLLYAVTAEAGQLKNGQRKAIATKKHNRRLSAKGYNKALWYQLAKQLGAKLRGGFDIDKDKAKAQKGTKLDPAATLDVLLLDLSLHERCNDQVREAMPKVLEKMQERTNKKLAKIMEKHSGK